MERKFDIQISPDQPILLQMYYEVPARKTGATDLLVRDRQEYLNRLKEISKNTKVAKNILFGKDAIHTSLFNDNKPREVELTAEGINKLFEGYQTGELKNSHVITIMEPTSPYSEAGLMIAAGKLQTCYEELDSQIIFDAPKIVQTEYWRQALKVLQNSWLISNQTPDNLKSLSGIRPLLVEHHARRVASENHPSLKSLSLHHGHLIFFNEDRARKEKWNMEIFKIDTEANLFNRKREPNLIKFTEKVSGLSGIEFTARITHPYGYQVDVNYDDYGKFTELMSVHFEAYSQASLETEQRLRERLGRKADGFFKGNVIQPAYGMILNPIDRVRANLVITPAVVAIGPIEKMGIRLLRGPEYPASISRENVEEFHKLILEGI